MKNIVICCDGTGNEIEANLSNVLKLYRILKKNADQVVYYDPGVGTVGRTRAFGRIITELRGVFGLMTGYGLDDNVLDAYRFLMENYEEGDQVYLFGFSRGAYTVRVLAGFLRLIGLLRPEQSNLVDYALTAYKQVAGEEDKFASAKRYQTILKPQRIKIKFLGIWDTVSSVFTQRPDRFYLPSRSTLPYTKKNSFVEVCRHALAIDERRRMFRVNHWDEPQLYKPNPFSDSEKDQDIKQVWFAGVHADVGGGYPEMESGLSKFALQWMIDEAKTHGLLTNTNMYNHLVLGHERKGGSNNYVDPNHLVEPHDSLAIFSKSGFSFMSILYWLMEFVPKSVSKREWLGRWAILFFWYFPLKEPRKIKKGARIHHSAIQKIDDDKDYDPINVPSNYEIEN